MKALRFLLTALLLASLAGCSSTASDKAQTEAEPPALTYDDLIRNPDENSYKETTIEGTVEVMLGDTIPGTTGIVVDVDGDAGKPALIEVDNTLLKGGRVLKGDTVKVTGISKGLLDTDDYTDTLYFRARVLEVTPR